jgi:tetratricopeptide (TPR) repeat protein
MTEERLHRPWSRHGLVCLILAAASVAPYAASLHGAFVYDDVKQIAGNPLIQDHRLVGKALASDVWAFKGDRGEAWSNYWRPGFVLWLILNHRLFGLRSTLGWHAASVALHATATLLAYALLLRLGLSWRPAAAACLLFAVHPVHVESVAWISGSPDPLVAVFLLGALWCVLAARGPRRAVAWMAAVLLHVAALLVKEIAVLFPLVVAVAWSATGPPAPRRERVLGALQAAAPFAAASAVYLLARGLVLGRVQVATPWRMGIPGILVNAPQLLAFYLRQSLWPMELGPSYRLRAVRPDALDAARFWLPLALVAACAGVAWRLARGSGAARLGLALFVLLLLPAFNIDAFIPEQLVHDRYLYLPLLGILLAIAARVDGPRTQGLALALALFLSVPLAVAASRYARAWTSERALWERGVRSDPGSSFNWAQYAHALVQEGDLAAARSAVDRALGIGPVTMGFLTRSEIAVRERRFAEAERDLLKVLADQPDNAQAYERLALCYQAEGRLAEAEATLRKGREWAPYRRCAFGSHIAAILYVAGRRAEALAELESVRPLTAAEPSAPCRISLVRLGSMYAELGRGADAARAFEEYLRLSAPFDDAETRALRQGVQRQLAGLGPGPTAAPAR